MREKAALYLLVISLIMIIGIDVTPYFYGGTNLFLGYLESIVDAAVVALTYLLLKRELNFRTKVLNMAAHDLRNPLGVIRGYSELILQKATSPETEREMMERIHTKSNEILQLVNDLLDSSVIEQRQVKLVKETTSLNLVAQQCLAEFEEHVHRKRQRVNFKAAEDIEVKVDPARMRQVFSNLVSNAIKYSPPGGDLEFRIERHGDLARVFVKDSGPGLSPEECRLIFDSFSKVKKPTTGGESSTGIGLSISKNLVELNGGKIWAESEGAGRGSLFIVEIPAD